MIAERAGVTPSTVYRRWGDLAQLLADTAAERLRPIADPDDTGSLAGDLRAFVLQYAEEMGSPVGRALMRDVLAETNSEVAAERCCAYTTHHLQTLKSRALQAWRGRIFGRRSDRHPDRADLLPHPVRERRALAGLCERAARALRPVEPRIGVNVASPPLARGRQGDRASGRKLAELAGDCGAAGFGSTITGEAQAGEAKEHHRPRRGLGSSGDAGNV